MSFNMESTIIKFYEAFEALDSEAMVSCYRDDVIFEDPAFGILKGARAKNMWRMLCRSQKGKDFKVVYSDINIKNNRASARWKAQYIFGKTGRKVHNIIDAEFTFIDGAIHTHHDRFNLYRWSRQALGIQGYLLGWTKLFKQKLNNQTNAMLTKFENQNFR